MSLRRKFILTLAAFSLAVAFTFGFLSWRIASDAFERELDRRLIQVAGAVAATGGIIGNRALAFEPGLEDDPFWQAYRARLDTLTRRDYVRDAFVFDARTTSEAPAPRALVTAAEADSVPTGTPLFELAKYNNEIVRAIEEGSATTEVFQGEDGTPYKYGFVRLEDTRAVLGVLITADFYDPLYRLGTTLLLASLAAGALAVFVGAGLAGNIARPLERMSRVALRIQRGHLEHPVPDDRADELGRLARAMERMRVAILERDERLRLMLAQVAHEIRNPLGGLELFASAAAETDDPVERSRLLGRMRDEVAALNRIIDDFLTFARPMQAERQGTDLRVPIEAAAYLMEAEIERGGGVLEVDLSSQPLMAAVDPDQVKRAVLNLLRNAAQAGGGRIRLTAAHQSSEVVVSVTDDGPGIPEEHRDRIFEPFVTDREQGAGLGLAIVKKVVEGHGGRVSVAPAEDEAFGSGAEFRLYFVGLDEPPPDAAESLRRAAAPPPADARTGSSDR